MELAVTDPRIPPVRSDADDSTVVLVARAKDGDVEAFERLYRRHVGRVHAVCLRVLVNREDAEEITQEVFVKAWRKLDRFEGRSAFGTWIHRAAVNASVDRLRSRKRRDAEVLGVDQDRGDLRIVGPEVGIDLERAVAGLPEGARLAFVLHDVEGFRHREIAEMTGKAEGTWKAQLHRARRLLREALSR